MRNGVRLIRFGTNKGRQSPKAQRDHESTSVPQSKHPVRRVTLKANICSEHGTTTCASDALSSFKNPIDASVVEKLRQSTKTVIMRAKSNMDEFGMGSHSIYSALGPVCNYGEDGVEYSAGGSSGGSAMSVLTEQCEVALGTDTGGSVRLPAAYTGVYGFKPSYGSISRNGVVAYANSLDTVGILARTTALIQKSWSLANRRDLNDATMMSNSHMILVKSESVKNTRHMKGHLRVGIPIEYNVKELNHEVRMAWNEVASSMREAGVKIIPISLPHTQAALSAYYVLASAEASSNLARYDGVRFGIRGSASDIADGVLYSFRRGSMLGKEVKKRILMGTFSLSSDAMDNYFIRAQKVRRLVQQDFDRVFRQGNILHGGSLNPAIHTAGVDIILCPTAPTLAPRLDTMEKMSSSEKYLNDIFTVPASLAGLPAISMPYKESKGPETNIGLQLIGQYGCDDFVLGLSRMLEADGHFCSAPVPTTSKGLVDDLKIILSEEKLLSEET